ncbi:MAG: hypothetical protein MZW92_61620 [Comamonadaceae bacterium]|nr:hypothetical protein [Comamonadaceae bacterium]
MTMSGFSPKKISNVSLHVGMTATLDFVLSSAKIETEVTVIGAAPVIDITDASLAKTYITKDLLLKLPTAQDTHAILNLAPGVTQLSAYGGGDQSGNSWTIDGTEVSSAWFGGGQYSTPIAYNTVEEQQIVGLGAPAEYGGFTGVFVNIITKSGGNQFHGDVQAPYRGKSWQSSNVSADDETLAAPERRPPRRTSAAASIWAARSSRTSCGSSAAPNTTKRPLCWRRRGRTARGPCRSSSSN